MIPLVMQNKITTLTNQPGALNLQCVDAERRIVPAKQKYYENTTLLPEKSLYSSLLRDLAFQLHFQRQASCLISKYLYDLKVLLAINSTQDISRLSNISLQYSYTVGSDRFV